MNLMFNSSRNLKLFPEGDPGISEAGDPSRSTPPESTGKTFSEDYVHALGNEAVQPYPKG